MGAEIEYPAPLAYTKIIYEQLPYYIAIGMTPHQYFDGDCCLVKYYRQADEMKKQRQNEFLWLQGMYVYDAILCASPALRAFGGSEPIPYPDKPYVTSKEEIIEREEEKRQSLIEEKRARMIEKAEAHNKSFKEKESGENGRH